MGSSKRLRKQRWVKVLNLLIDDSRGYCLGDLCEEFERRSQHRGQLKSIAWLCKEVVLSRSYLIPYSHLRGRFTELWSKIVAAIGSLGAEVTKMMLRPQIGMARVAFFVLFASFVFWIYTQLHQRKNSDLALNTDEISSAGLSNSNWQTVILVPGRMERSGGETMRRISIDPTVSVVRFDLELPFDEAELLYQVALSTIEGELFVVKGIRPVNKKLSIPLSATLIRTGDYMLTASPGPNSRGYSYFFRVR